MIIPPFFAGQHLALSPKLFSAHESSTVWITIAMIVFGCFLAFMISVAEFLLLSHTSSLTLTISGIFKVRWDPEVGVRWNLWHGFCSAKRVVDTTQGFVCISHTFAHVWAERSSVRVKCLPQHHSSKWCWPGLKSGLLDEGCA